MRQDGLTSSKLKRGMKSKTLSLVELQSIQLAETHFPVFYRVRSQLRLYVYYIAQ